MQLQDRQTKEINKVILKKFAPFTGCINKLYNTLPYNAKDLVVVMPIYDLVEFSYNYSKHVESYGYFVEMNK